MAVHQPFAAGRAPAAAGWPASGTTVHHRAGHKTPRIGMRWRLAESLQHVGADLELARPDARPQPNGQVRVRSRPPGTRPTAPPRPRRRPGRASRHAPRPPLGPGAPRAAAAGSRPPARRRRYRARRSRLASACGGPACAGARLARHHTLAVHLPEPDRLRADACVESPAIPPPRPRRRQRRCRGSGGPGAARSPRRCASSSPRRPRRGLPVRPQPAGSTG